MASVPDALALQLASLARRLRADLLDALAHEPPLQRLHMACDALVEHAVADFADALAQTLTYVLFAARCQHRGPATFTRTSVFAELPTGSPLVHELLQLLACPPERARASIDALVELLADADIHAVLAPFERSERDGVMHFYELLLSKYDARLRQQRGVFYTPPAVVGYIVRSVDELLRDAFMLEGGLADERVSILDPALGTGTFLHAIVEHVAVSGGSLERLLPRMFGCELLLAPYVVAHVWLGLRLRALGHTPTAGERLHVHLGNSLASPRGRSPRSGIARLFADEARAAERVRTRLPITVVLGNPPYAGHSANAADASLRAYAHAYKHDAQGRPYPELARPGQAKWLSDDYVKFIRLAHTRIAKTGHGIVAFVTNDAWLDNPTFFGMRRALLDDFDELWLLDLHGSSKKQASAPEQGRDENLFDIQQGVTIAIMARYPQRRAPRVWHAQLRGERAEKSAYLATHARASTSWSALQPGPPSWSGGPAWLFVPARSDAPTREYAEYWGLPEVFSGNGKPAPGIVTTHDQFAISWSRAEMLAKVERLLASSSEHEVRQIWRLCSQRQWRYDRAISQLRESPQWREHVIAIQYRPFDTRYTVYDRNVAVHRRERVSRHLLAGSLALVSSRQRSSDDEWAQVFCVDRPIESTLISNRTKEINYALPLWLHDHDPPSCTLDPAFVAALPGAPTPAQVFAYVYAILHAPSYRRRYATLLRSDWARVPVCKDTVLFEALCELGQRLVELHIWARVPAGGSWPSAPDPGSNVVERVRWEDGSVWINENQHFADVPEHAWTLQIGSYRPAHKWLDDRRAPGSAALSSDDIAHYRRLVAVLRETGACMREIDAAIHERGGWPLTAG